MTDKTLMSRAEKAVTLQKNFDSFISQYKDYEAKAKAAWESIEEAMIANDIKSLKGDWGSITIAERTNFNIDKEQLPPRFWKKVPDETKIRTIYQLEGKLPTGTTSSVLKYLTKRLK